MRRPRLRRARRCDVRTFAVLRAMLSPSTEPSCGAA
jgi:hypothetical protein